MLFSRHPFKFYPKFLHSGYRAKTYTLPNFCKPIESFEDSAEVLESRLHHFCKRLTDHFKGFFGFRGNFLPKQVSNDSKFMKEQLWHSSALLGFLEDRSTRMDLKDGKIPTLVRFERPASRSLHDRVFQNVPLFGVSTAALVNLGVPLPWNMLGAGFATAVREFSEDFQTHREFQGRLREEFKKTGRDPKTYIDLYNHLDHVIPHSLKRGQLVLPVALRAKNYGNLKAFHVKLDEVHQYAAAYLEAIHALRDSVEKGYSQNKAIARAVFVAKQMVQNTKHARLGLEPILKEKGLATEFNNGHIEPSVPEADLESVSQAPMVQNAKERILAAARIEMSRPKIRRRRLLKKSINPRNKNNS